MHEVVVNKDELLSKLKDNKLTHQEAYAKAMEGYKETLKEEYESRLAKLNTGTIPEQSPNLPKPQDHSEEYDQVITMVEMSVEKELKLSSQEFAQFVMDNWGWKKHFAQTTAMYAG